MKFFDFELQENNFVVRQHEFTQFFWIIGFFCFLLITWITSIFIACNYSGFEQAVGVIGSMVLPIVLSWFFFEAKQEWRDSEKVFVFSVKTKRVKKNEKI